MVKIKLIKLDNSTYDKDTLKKAIDRYIKTYVDSHNALLELEVEPSKDIYDVAYTDLNNVIGEIITVEDEYICVNIYDNFKDLDISDMSAHLCGLGAPKNEIDSNIIETVIITKIVLRSNTN